MVSVTAGEETTSSPVAVCTATRSAGILAEVSKLTALAVNLSRPSGRHGLMHVIDSLGLTLARFQSPKKTSIRDEH